VRPPYISLKNLPNPIKQYVAWIDIMGTKSFYKKTSKSPMLYILKLHACAEAAIRTKNGLTYYPVADGLFLTHNERAPLLTAVKEIFQGIALDVINTHKVEYRYMIRAGLAFGEINHGSDITLEEEQLPLNNELKRSLVFGKALVDATEAEKGQPPFSVTIYDSISNSEPLSVSGLEYEYYAWFNDGFDKKEEFKDAILEYYIWIKKHDYWVNGYDETKMKQHLFDFLIMLDSTTSS
jgi:hypothetical protein